MALSATSQSDFDRVTQVIRLALASSKTKYPVIHTANDSITVGSFSIVKQDTVWVADSMQFGEKASAVFYCAMKSIKRYGLAADIHKADQSVLRLSISKAMYRDLLNAAHECNDGWRIDLYSARLDAIKPQLSLAKKDIMLLWKRAMAHLSHLPIH